MKYINCRNSDLRICKLFNKFLNEEELEIKATLQHLSNSSEVVKLENHAVCAFSISSVGVNTKLHIGRKNSVQYFFSIEDGLERLMRSSLLNGSIDDFIKTASYESNLIKILFNLVSSKVKSWLINRVTKINIINLNHYQFIEQRKGRNYITLTLFMTAINTLGGFIQYKDEDLDNKFGHLKDEHLIASYIDEFIKERS